LPNAGHLTNSQKCAPKRPTQHDFAAEWARRHREPTEASRHAEDQSVPFGADSAVVRAGNLHALEKQSAHG